MPEDKEIEELKRRLSESLQLPLSTVDQMTINYLQVHIHGYHVIVSLPGGVVRPPPVDQYTGEDAEVCFDDRFEKGSKLEWLDS